MLILLQIGDKTMTKQEIINRLENEGNTIRINSTEIIATEWKTDSKKPSRKYSECYELIEGRWEGFVAVK
jgi:hypothetical protein